MVNKKKFSEWLHQPDDGVPEWFKEAVMSAKSPEHLRQYRAKKEDERRQEEEREKERSIRRAAKSLGITPEEYRERVRKNGGVFGKSTEEKHGRTPRSETE